MSDKVDKKLILNKIKDGYKFNSDSEFAKFLGIRPQTLSNWMTRNSFDIDVVYTKCVGINTDFLLSGVGSVFKPKQEVLSTFANPAPSSYLNSEHQAFKTEEPGTTVFKLKTDLIQEKQLVPLYDIQATASTVSLFRDSSNEKPVDHISIPNLPNVMVQYM